MHQPSRRDFLRGAALLSLSAGALLATGCSSGSAETPTTKPTPTGAPSIPEQYRKYPSILSNASSGESLTFWGWDTLKFNKPIEDYVAAVAGVTTAGRQIPNDDLQAQPRL